MKTKSKTKPQPAKRPPTVLRFSPTAWAKLLFLRDLGDTEIGGFGISASDDLLLIEDVKLVAQVCTWAHVEFEDEAVADFFDEEIDAGRRPESFGRVWIHTHPGNSPEPSSTDEVTFSRVFERSDWAVMFILARGGQMFARLRYNVGPGAELKLPVEVDFSQPFNGSDFDAWEREYRAKVRLPPPEPTQQTSTERKLTTHANDDWFLDDWRRKAWEDYLQQAEQQSDYEFDNYF